MPSFDKYYIYDEKFDSTDLKSDTPEWYVWQTWVIIGVVLLFTGFSALFYRKYLKKIVEQRASQLNLLSSGGYTQRQVESDIELSVTTSKRVAGDHMSRLTPGVYIMEAQANITLDVDRNSQELRRRLNAGDKVFVEEVKYVDDRVRGRLSTGGWISIASTDEDAWIWAKPEGFKGGHPRFEGEIHVDQQWYPAVVMIIDRGPNTDPIYRGTVLDAPASPQVTKIGMVYDQLNPMDVHIFSPIVDDEGTKRDASISLSNKVIEKPKQETYETHFPFSWNLPPPKRVTLEQNNIAIPGLVHGSFKRSVKKVHTIQQKYSGDSSSGGDSPNISCANGPVKLTRAERVYIFDFYRAFNPDAQFMFQTHDCIEIEAVDISNFLKKEKGVEFLFHWQSESGEITKKPHSLTARGKLQGCKRENFTV